MSTLSTTNSLRRNARDLNAFFANITFVFTFLYFQMIRTKNVFKWLITCLLWVFLVISVWFTQQTPNKKVFDASSILFTNKWSQDELLVWTWKWKLENGNWESITIKFLSNNTFTWFPVCNLVDKLNTNTSYKFRNNTLNLSYSWDMTLRGCSRSSLDNLLWSWFISLNNDSEFKLTKTINNKTTTYIFKKDLLSNIFNSKTIIVIVSIMFLIILSIYYTHQKNKKSNTSQITT